MHIQTIRILAAPALAGLLLSGCDSSSAPQQMALSGYLAPSCAGYPKSSQDAVTVCEHRAFIGLPSLGHASVATRNGDVAAQGAARADVRLDAYVYATAATEQAAKDLAGQVAIHTDNNDFYATGPDNPGGASCNVEVMGQCAVGASSGSSAGTWSASFSAALPTLTGLTASAANGVIAADGLDGRHSISTSNGGIYLSGLAGELTVSSSNGSIDIDLRAPTWKGDGIDASTGNGSIAFHAPANYGAEFELESTNGSVHSDFSGRTESGPGAQISETTGGGGPAIKARAANGDVDLLIKS